MFVCVSFSCEGVYVSISHSKKNSVKYRYKCTQFFKWSTLRCSCQNLTKLDFLSTDFRKILGYKVSWKICVMGAELLRGDRRLDRHNETISPFRNFTKAHKNNKGGRGMVWMISNGTKDEKKSMARFGIMCVSGSAFPLLRAWTQTIFQDFLQFTPWFAYY